MGSAVEAVGVDDTAGTVVEEDEACRLSSTGCTALSDNFFLGFVTRRFFFGGAASASGTADVVTGTFKPAMGLECPEIDSVKASLTEIGFAIGEEGVIGSIAVASS